MRFDIDKENSSTGCSTSQSRFRRCRRPSATLPFKWGFRFSTTAKAFCLWISNVICVANQLCILIYPPVAFDGVVVEFDVEFIPSILRPPPLQPVKQDGMVFQSRMLSPSVTKLEWLEVKYSKVTNKFMPKYLFRRVHTE